MKTVKLRKNSPNSSTERKKNVADPSKDVLTGSTAVLATILCKLPRLNGRVEEEEESAEGSKILSRFGFVIPVTYKIT